MVAKRKCTFCDSEIEPGTGMMYVKKSGSIFYFCSSKCRKNFLHLGREPRKTRWSKRFGR